MKLEDRFAQKLRSINRKRGTVDRYVGAYLRYMRWIRETRGKWIHPADLNEKDLESWLTHLAVDQNVSPSTQNQALSGIIALYKLMFDRELVGINALRAKKNETIRTPISRDKVAALIDSLRGVGKLAGLILYSSGMRIQEFCQLRIKDFDFDNFQITIHQGKGGKDRLVQFPKVVHDAVLRQFESARVLWREDIAEGRNGVSLPYAYGRKCSSAHHDFGWYYLIPSDVESRDPETGFFGRHHKSQDAIRDMIHHGVRRAGIVQRVTPHVLRHSYATHSLENGMPIHVLQKLMGHEDIRTTEGYLHLCKSGPTSAKSPIEFLQSIHQTDEQRGTRSRLAEMLANPEAIKQRRSVTVSSPALRISVG